MNLFSEQEWQKKGYIISTDKQRLDIAFVHNFLANEGYWTPGIERGLVERAIQGSLTFGLYEIDGEQIGFAKVITDGTLFAYLADVFVISAHRGMGLGTWLAECAVNHPELQTIRRWVLLTDDAHEVYRRIGFEELNKPELYMQKIKHL